MSQTFLQLYCVMTLEGWNHISTLIHYSIFTTHKLSLSKFWQSCGKVCDTSLTQKLLHIVNTFRRSNSIAAKSRESVNQDIESAISLVTCKYCPIKIFAIKKKLRRGKNYIYICKHCFFLHPSRPWMLNLLGIPRNLFILFFSIILVLEPNVQLHFNPNQGSSLIVIGIQDAWGTQNMLGIRNKLIFIFHPNQGPDLMLGLAVDYPHLPIILFMFRFCFYFLKLHVIMPHQYCLQDQNTIE